MLISCKPACNCIHTNPKDLETHADCRLIPERSPGSFPRLEAFGHPASTYLCMKSVDLTLFRLSQANSITISRKHSSSGFPAGECQWLSAMRPLVYLTDEPFMVHTKMPPLMDGEIGVKFAMHVQGTMYFLSLSLNVLGGEHGNIQDTLFDNISLKQ